jgi:DNA-binding NtrC family response regulator
MNNEGKARILIVDDDPFFLRVITRILARERFEVEAASGAQEAVRILNGQKFDVIVSDLRLPDGDGISLVESLRQAGDSTPVVILTAYGEVDSYLEAMNAGANEYLNKPVRSEDLIRVLRNCLRARSEPRRARAS